MGLDVYRHRKMMFTDIKKNDQTFTDDWDEKFIGERQTNIRNWKPDRTSLTTLLGILAGNQPDISE